MRTGEPTEDRPSTIIYVQLIDEAVPMWRPVPAMHIADNIYLLGGADMPESISEQWEFMPGSRVAVEMLRRHGDFGIESDCPTAVRAIEGIAYRGDFRISTSELINIEQTSGNVKVKLKLPWRTPGKNDLLKLVFSGADAVLHHERRSEQVTGLQEIIQPGCRRRFRLLSREGEPLLELIADDFLLEEDPSP